MNKNEGIIKTKLIELQKIIKGLKILNIAPN
jgi:hypothetical protein